MGGKQATGFVGVDKKGSGLQTGSSLRGAGKQQAFGEGGKDDSTFRAPAQICIS